MNRLPEGRTPFVAVPDWQASNFRPRFLPGRQEEDTPRGTVAELG